MEQYGKIEEMDRSFDIEYWQRQGAERIFDAAWQLVLDSYSFKGLQVNELRLQRSIEAFGRL